MDNHQLDWLISMRSGCSRGKVDMKHHHGRRSAMDRSTRLFSVPGWSSPPKAVPELQIVWNPNPATWRLGYPYEISRVSTKMGTTLSTTPPREGVGYIYIYIIVYLIIYICIIYTCVGVYVCMYVYIYIHILLAFMKTWRLPMQMMGIYGNTAIWSWSYSQQLDRCCLILPN